MFSSDKLKLMLAMVPDAMVADFTRQRADDETAAQIIQQAIDGRLKPVAAKGPLKPPVKANGAKPPVKASGAEAVLQAIARGVQTPRDIRADLDLSEAALARHLQRLRKAKRIVRRGKFRGVRYFVRAAA